MNKDQAHQRSFRNISGVAITAYWVYIPTNFGGELVGIYAHGFHGRARFEFIPAPLALQGQTFSLVAIDAFTGTSGKSDG